MMEYYNKLTAEKLLDLQFDFDTSNKKVGKENLLYINLEAAFDIETTSTIEQGSKVAFMYIWQLGLGYGLPVYYGRTWDEFIQCINLISDTLKLDSNKRLIIYVHNLGYEFQFMKDHFVWDNVFAINERKPIKALTDSGIEFRDSYILSGYSLANTAKNLSKYKIEKLVGDLDYSLIRHNKTPLTDLEMQYCENDIVIILAYIKEQIEQYGDITKIPLTNTGRVRQFVKDSCLKKSNGKTDKSKFKKYRKVMRDLTLTPDDYIQLKRAFMGGFTHSNPAYTNATIQAVDSVDLASSYPTVMLSDKYPMSRPRKLLIDSIDGLKKAFNKFCVLFDVKFIGLKNKIGYESYLSDSKCYNKKNALVNNGRIFDADELITTITDVDFNIIEQVYSWDEIQISNVKGFRKNYLPKSIIESILKLYGDKTTLKDVEGSEVEYLLSKGMLNSVYGMSVTDFVKDDHTFTDKWEIEKCNLDEKIEEYNDSVTRFLYYPWGIWVTAYARRNLWSAILSLKNDYLYSDTDSVKMINYENHKPYLEAYNKNVLHKLGLMMDYYELDHSLLSPDTIKGVSKPLGVWEHEGHYDNFKTLGAKRYLIEQNGEFHLTVAGLSKKNGINYITEICENNSDEIFALFNDGLYIPSTNTGKMTHTYIDEPIDLQVTDFKGNTLDVHTKSGIHLGSCDFTLSISKQYSDFVDMVKQGQIYKGIKHV